VTGQILLKFHISLVIQLTDIS